MFRYGEFNGKFILNIYMSFKMLKTVESCIDSFGKFSKIRFSIHCIFVYIYTSSEFMTLLINIKND